MKSKSLNVRIEQKNWRLTVEWTERQCACSESFSRFFWQMHYFLRQNFRVLRVALANSFGQLEIVFHLRVLVA